MDTDRMIRLMIETVLKLERGERTAEEEAFAQRVEAELGEARRKWPGWPPVEAEPPDEGH